MPRVLHILTVALWHLSLALSTLAHGRILAALARALHSRTWSHSGSSRSHSAFSHTVAFWQLSLALCILAHGRILASFVRSRRSRTQSNSGSVRSLHSLSDGPILAVSRAP